MTSLNQKMRVAVAISAVSMLAFTQLAIAAAPTSAAPTTTADTATPSSTLPDISGKYKCSGYDPYAKSNFTETMLYKKSGDTYTIQFFHGDNGIPYNLGTAVLNKNLPNAVSYVYWDPKKPTAFGTGLYELKSDGGLDGLWSSQGTNQYGTETCTKS